MKTRIVVHIALNAKNERVGHLVCAAGMLIPFSLPTAFHKDKNKPISFWMNSFADMPSVKHWKQYCKEVERAVRFQRVTLLGETR